MSYLLLTEIGAYPASRELDNLLCYICYNSNKLAWAVYEVWSSADFFVMHILASPFQCARQGFALGLTVLVGTISTIKLDSLLKLIVDLLEVSSSMKGQVSKNHVCIC